MHLSEEFEYHRELYVHEVALYILIGFLNVGDGVAEVKYELRMTFWLVKVAFEFAQEREFDIVHAIDLPVEFVLESGDTDLKVEEVYLIFHQYYRNMSPSSVSHIFCHCINSNGRNKLTSFSL